MMEFRYYILGSKPYCVLNIGNRLNKTFILPNCKDFLLYKEILMIEVDILEDYFLKEKLKPLFLDQAIEASFESKYVSKEKFDISFSHEVVDYSLKSYVPFWGKTMSNICWVGFLSRN